MTLRILIAEDHQPLAESLIALISRHGYQVEHAADGVAALCAVAAAPPDLLLLDLKLPGMHGVEMLKKLRQSSLTAQLPVIVVTGAYRGEPYRQAARNLGVCHYLEKPFKAADLMSAIAQCLPVARSPLLTTEPKPQRFAEHLQQAFRTRFSGQLLLNWPGQRRTLSFINGAPVAVHPGFLHGDFADYLRRQGVITTEEHGYLTNQGALSCEILVQMGCLSYGELLDARFAYLNQELEQAFAAPPASADWQAMPVPEALQLVTLNVPQLFYRGFHRCPGEAAELLLASSLGKYPTPAGDYYRHINFLALSEEECQLLSLFDGHHTLAECCVDPAASAPLLLTLLALDMLRFADQPAEPVAPGDLPLRLLFNAAAETTLVESVQPLESFADLTEEAAAVPLIARSSTAETPAAPDDLLQDVRVRLMAKSLEGKDHYEVFEIKPAQFSIELLKERYFAVTRQFGPDTLMRLGGEHAALVEGILARVANAYNTLSDVVKKERYDELLGADRIGLGQQGDDRFQAEVQAESGKVFIGMEEWDSAEKALQEAVNFDPGNGDVLAHLAWSIYRNPRNRASRATQEKALKMVNRAVNMQRTAAGFAFKGWMLMEIGQDLLAEAEFSKALKLDPRQVLARQGLRALQEKKEQQKKGLFGRMFKQPG